MRLFITSVLLITSLVTFGQKKEKLSLVLQVQPELTFYKNDYAFRWSDKYVKRTGNIGFSGTVRYNITERLFADGGIGFVTRKLNTKVFVDQSKLPPPYYDSTKILYTARSVSFRMLQFPVGIGYNFIKKERKNFYARMVFVPNFILNTKYVVNHYPAFKKNQWQGYSLNFGLGFDYRLNKKLQLTNSLVYSAINTVARDNYTFSQDETRIALTHTYLQLSTGIKLNL